MSAWRMTFRAIVREAFGRIAIMRSRLLLLVVARLGVSKNRSDLLQRDGADCAQEARHYTSSVCVSLQAHGTFQTYSDRARYPRLRLR
jgi:hypothetical protein